MKIREDLTIGRPAEAVWSLLADRELVVGCVPGLDRGDGVLLLEVGDDRLCFSGRADVKLRPESRALRVELHGDEASGRGRGRARLSLWVEDGGLFSVVHVEADVRLTGTLGALQRTGLVVEAAHRLADRFAECVESRLSVAPVPPGAAGAYDGPDASPAAALAFAPDHDDRPGWLSRVIRRLRRR